MKTKTWVILIAVLLAVCLGLSIWILLPGEAAAYARITSDGQQIAVLDLGMDGSHTVALPNGDYNTLTVEGGKIAVTEATCPDHYCMNRGFCNSGTDIVCLPNRLVIHFMTDTPAVDGAVG